MELLTLIALGGFVYLYSRFRSLEIRLDQLEQRNGKQVENYSEVSPTMVGQADHTPLYDSITYPTNPATPTPASESKFWLWLKEDTLVKIGALLLILALAWFVSYAFANNWIGPVGQIMLGLLFGAGVLIFGTLRMRTSSNQGSIFAVVGSTAIIMTITAAQYIYQMFPPLVALSIIFMVVVYVTFLSLQYERSQLAYASLVSALIAPFLINSNTGDALMFMLYLLLVVSGTLWVVWRLRAEKITLVALIGVLGYTAIAYNLDTGVALLFSFIFTGIFFITNIISLIRRYTEWVSPVHIMTALITGVYLISSILSSAQEEWISTYLIFWALVFAYGSYQVFLRTLNKIPFFIYAGVSVVLIGTATAVELDGAILTIMLTLEVLLSIILMGRLGVSHKSLNIATAILIVPGLLTIEHLDSYAWRSDSWYSDFFALAIFCGALVLAGLARKATTSELEGEVGTLGLGQKVLYSLAAIYASAILWLVLHAILPAMIATMLAMIIYSVVGLALYVIGKAQDDKMIKKAGMVVLSLVVIRLLLVDVWALETTGRIITFLIIGLLFMSTAFLPKLKKHDN